MSNFPFSRLLRLCWSNRIQRRRYSADILSENRRDSKAVHGYPIFCILLRRRHWYLELVRAGRGTVLFRDSDLAAEWSIEQRVGGNETYDIGFIRLFGMDRKKLNLLTSLHWFLHRSKNCASEVMVSWSQNEGRELYHKPKSTPEYRTFQLGRLFFNLANVELILRQVAKNTPGFVTVSSTGLYVREWQCRPAIPEPVELLLLRPHTEP